MKVFGLIGYPLSHSFSKKYFSGRFDEEKITDCSYENFELATIRQITSLIKKTPYLSGLNVTIPYKEQVIPFLHTQTDVVKATGACNCIAISEGMLHGHNTDTTGFEQSLIKFLFPHHSEALVLGTGGAAKAVGYVLRKLGIGFHFVSRNVQLRGIANTWQYRDLTPDIMQSHLLIINTTPLGMFPNVDAAPPIDYSLLTARHYLYDLVYNPAKTLFLEKGELKGGAIQNGYDMLIIQAEESWKIWNGMQ